MQKFDVPDGWNKKKLNDLSIIKGRVGWRGYTVADLRENGPITLGANNITDSNQLTLDNSKYISKEKLVFNETYYGKEYLIFQVI